MRHRFEIEDEIKRVEPYTSVTDDYASAWEYVEARNNRSYQNTLEAFLKCKNKEEFESEKGRLEEVFERYNGYVKDFYKGNREVFTDTYQAEQCEEELIGARRALNYIFQESTIIKELGDENARILKQIDRLKGKYEENCNKIRKVQKWMEEN